MRKSSGILLGVLEGGGFKSEEIKSGHYMALSSLPFVCPSPAPVILLRSYVSVWFLREWWKIYIYIYKKIWIFVCILSFVTLQNTKTSTQPALLTLSFSSMFVLFLGNQAQPNCVFICKYLCFVIRLGSFLQRLFPL